MLLARLLVSSRLLAVKILRFSTVWGVGAPTPHWSRVNGIYFLVLLCKELLIYFHSR